MFFLLRLLRIAWTALGLAQWTDWSVAMNLLMTRQARLHRRWLLPVGKRTDIIRAHRTPTSANTKEINETKWRSRNHKNNLTKEKYLNETLKSDLNVGCIPIDDGACWMRDAWFEISFGLLAESPRKPAPTDGGAGGKNPCEGFSGVMCGESEVGKGWCGAWDWLVNADTGVGRVKLAVDVVSLPE